MPKIRKVVTTVWYNLENMKRLRQVFCECEFVYVDFYDREKLAEEVRNADVCIVMGDVDDCLLGENTLKWIHCDHAGLNGSARPEVFARGIPVTGSAGRSAPVLAEHCIYFMLQQCYHTKELLKAQSEARWGVEGSGSFRGLYGRTAGIIGMGNNGRMLAERLNAFGMRLYCYDKYPIAGIEYAEKKLIFSEGDTIEPILKECDFIILTVSLTDETFHMIDYSAFTAMRKDAFIVNMARGGLICTEDMIKALKEGLISGAGLDVFEQQPLSADSPLWKMENVYITPHMTPQVLNRDARSIEIIAENKRRFEAGEQLKNLMKKEDAMSGEKAEGGWSLMMKTGMTREQIAKMDLEKYLGKRGWTDTTQWM